MEKSSVDIAKYIGLCHSTLNLILCRAEFTGAKKGTKYRVDIGFIDELIKCFEKKKTRKHLEVKYSKAQMKLYQWRRKLVKQDEVRNEICN